MRGRKQIVIEKRSLGLSLAVLRRWTNLNSPQRLN